MTLNRPPMAVLAAASGVLLFIGATYLSNEAASGLSSGLADRLRQIGDAFPIDMASFWTLFAALFAIMNPLIAVPLFVRVTRGRRAIESQRLAGIASLSVLLALLAAAIAGQQLLDFFAISIGAFRISGGVIVLLMGLAMMRSESSGKSSSGTGEGPASEGDSVAICPLAIPLLAGPGAIATIIVESQAALVPADFATIAAVIMTMVALTYLVLRLAAPIARALGPTGLMVATRLIGMIVAAIAIDMMVIGLRLSFPAAL